MCCSIRISLSREIFYLLFSFSFSLSYPRRVCCFSFLFFSPLRDALATPPRLIRVMGFARLLRDHPISFLFHSPWTCRQFASRLASRHRCSVTFLELERCSVFAPFPAAAMRPGQEPTDLCRNGNATTVWAEAGLN